MMLVHCVIGLVQGSPSKCLYDAICVQSSPATQDYLQVLIIWINLSLSGKVNPSLSPWLARAS